MASEVFQNSSSSILQEDIIIPSPGFDHQPPHPSSLPPAAGSFVPIIIFLVLTLVTVFENALVILAFCFNRSLRMYFNYFLLSMAVADLAVGVIDMPLTVVWALLGYWPFGKVACALFAILDNVLIHWSVLSVLVICLDRHYSVVEPLKHLRSRSLGRALKLILPAYGAAIAGWGTTVTTLWLVSSEGERPTDQQCFIPLAQDLVYRISFEVALFWLPCFLLVIFYSRVIIAIRRRQKNLERRETPTTSQPPQVNDQGKTRQMTGEKASATGRISGDTNESQQKENNRLGINISDDENQIPSCNNTAAIVPPAAHPTCPGVKNALQKFDRPVLDTEGCSGDVLPAKQVSPSRDAATVHLPSQSSEREDEKHLDSAIPMTLFSSPSDEVTPVNSAIHDGASLTPPRRSSSSPSASRDDALLTARVAEGTADAQPDAVEVDVKSAHTDVPSGLPAINATEDKSITDGNIKREVRVEKSPVFKISPTVQDKIPVQKDRMPNAQKRPRQQSGATVSRGNTKAIRTMSFIALALLISWTPWAVINVLENVSPGTVPPVFVETGIFWVYLNSALNPLCYAAGSKTYRRAMLNLLRCKCN